MSSAEVLTVVLQEERGVEANVKNAASLASSRGASNDKVLAMGVRERQEVEVVGVIAFATEIILSAAGEGEDIVVPVLVGEDIVVPVLVDVIVPKLSASGGSFSMVVVVLFSFFFLFLVLAFAFASIGVAFLSS